MTDRVIGGTVAVVALCLLAACSATPTPTTPTPTPTPTSAATTVAAGIPVSVTSNTCGSGWRHPSTGLATFQVRNASPSPIDVTLTNSGTGAVYAELEALGPGTTRPMQVDIGSGSYAFRCDSASGAPITGPAILIPGHVPGGQAVVPPDVTEELKAVASERGYEMDGLATVARQAAVLADDIEAGNLSAARGAWLTAHLSYERLGSAYGMFGNYDDAIDGDPDGLPGGVNDRSFTGFYRIEYGLWHGQSAAELTGPAVLLVRNIRALRTAYPGMIAYPQAELSDLALRTHEIIEHTIRFQLGGADDFGSGTTLATADANIDADEAQLAMLRPMLLSRYPRLPSVYNWLGRLKALIDAEHTSTGWTPVSRLTPKQRGDINAAAAQTAQLLAPIAVIFESSPLP